MRRGIIPRLYAITNMIVLMEMCGSKRAWDIIAACQEYLTGLSSLLQKRHSGDIIISKACRISINGHSGIEES